VPVYNGRQTIGGTVECLLRQTRPAHEIIIVDDGSVDGTAEVLRPLADRVRVLSKPNGGPASARNVGVRAATGDFVAFTDSDCLPDREWLAALLKGFEGERVAGVGGIVRGLSRELISEYADVTGILDPERDRAGSVASLVTANACFRRDALLEAGLFDERFRKPGGEEAELCKRVTALGYKLAFVEEAVVLHHHKQTVKIFLKTMANYGEGRFVFGTIWPEHRLPGDARREMLRHLLALRTMLRRSLAYRPQYGLRKALFFSLLDQLKYPAFLWGYLRGRKSFR
jgi:O-antigen biosynthesis protein